VGGGLAAASVGRGVRHVGAEVSPTGDLQCVVGAATTGEPGALISSGSFNPTVNPGPLARKAQAINWREASLTIMPAEGG
jgi:hypothetical protein